MTETTKMFIRALEKAVQKGHNELELTLDTRGIKDLHEDMIRLKEEITEILIGKENNTEEEWKPGGLNETVDMMCSKDYKERFVAEYWQTKIRYEKLKKRNTMAEAYRRAREAMHYENVIPRGDIGDIKELPHDCPNEMLAAQQHIMGEYLHILELRAVLEGIDL